MLKKSIFFGIYAGQDLSAAYDGLKLETGEDIVIQSVDHYRTCFGIYSEGETSLIGSRVSMELSFAGTGIGIGARGELKMKDYYPADDGNNPRSYATLALTVNSGEHSLGVFSKSDIMLEMCYDRSLNLIISGNGDESCRAIMSEGDLSLIGDEFVLRSSGDGFYADGDICLQARKISVEAEGDAIYTETGNVTVLECGALKLTGANGIVVGEGSTEGTVDLSQSDRRDLTATITATKGSAIRTKGDVLLPCAAILTGAVHAIEAKNVNCAANAEVLYAVGESASAIKVTNTVEFCSNESYIQGKTYGIEVVGDPDTVLDLNGGVMHIEGETAVANVGMKVPAATLIDDTAVSAVDPSGKYASIAPAVGKSLKCLEPEYNFLITVADTTINAQNCDNVLSGTENDGKVSYDPFTRTLSLKDAKIEALSAFAIRVWSSYPVTIHLTGENTLTTSTKFEWYSSLIHSDAGLRLTGEGKPVLTAGLYADGIATDADLIVDGPHITVVSSLNGLVANRLDVASGILDITSTHTAVGTAEYVRITDSTVNITAEARGLAANLGGKIALGNIYISNTALTVNAGLCGIRGDDLHVTSSTLDITALSCIEVTDCAITDRVTVDLTGFDSAIDTVRIPGALLSAIAAKETELAVRLTSGSVTLDADALKSLPTAVRRNSLKLALERDAYLKLNLKQRAAIGDLEVLDVCRVNLHNASTHRRVTSLGGTMTASAAIDLSGYEAGRVSVYAITETSALIPLESRYENGNLTWTAVSLDPVVIVYGAE